MIEQVDELGHETGLGDMVLPTMPLDLSTRMRELRARQGLKQSEVARRMGLDPSIPSLWEQGKRPVPANRVQALAQALRVSVAELLEGVVGAPEPRRPINEGPARGLLAGLDRHADERAFRPRSTVRSAPLLTQLTPYLDLAPTPAPLSDADRVRAVEAAAAEVAPPPFVVAPRPSLVGEIPAGWEPSERIKDLDPALAEGYYLDPVRLERPAAKQQLRQRLCAADQALVGESEVPGLALAERIHTHCSHLEGFHGTSKLPLVEAIFRAVLAADQGGLTTNELLDLFAERSGGVSVDRALLRRMRESVRPYPVRWVDKDYR